MGNLNAPDVRRLMACCAEIYRWDPHESEAPTFAEHVVGVIPRLIDGAVATFQSFEFRTRTTQMVLSGLHEEVAAHAPAFFAHLHEHPLVEHARITGDTAALRISDLVPWSAFQNTGLYNEFFRPLGLRHQMAASLPAADGEVVGLAVAREAGTPDFSGTDQELLSLFRLHVLQAQEIARRVDALRDRLLQAQEMLEAVDDGVAVLESDLRIRAASGQAAAMLDRHFGAGTRAAPRRDLPTVVHAWVEAQVTNWDAGTAPRCATVLETAAGSVRLQLARRGGGGGQWLLVIEEAARGGPPRVPDHLREKLTRREAEVLQWLAAGKTNPEIAIILGTSPRTVQKHVEHILAKLGVENRHAAAVRVLEFSA